MTVEDKVRRLEQVIEDLGSVVVTFSGGVDSALLAAVAHRTLGERSVAITAVSPTFPKEELEVSRRVAKERGFRLVEVDSHELEVDGYKNNAGDRCYFCKSELFDLARTYAGQHGFRWVADGTIVDDLGDHRPGLKAASEREVRHPLVEASFTKSDVRAVAESIGLSVWSKPSFACLGSRFPVGTRVELDKVNRVARAESVLRELGFHQFRVRWHETSDGVMARVEVGADELVRLSSTCRHEIQAKLATFGFRWVVLDLVAYGE